MWLCRSRFPAASASSANGANTPVASAHSPAGPAPNAEFGSERQWWNKMIGATQTNQLKLGNGNGHIAGVLVASICTPAAAALPIEAPHADWG